MAADIRSSYLLDAMDKLWFYKNIIFQPMLTRPEGISTTLLPENSSHSQSQSSDENKNRQSSYKDKMPARLNIAIGQPLFQLQSVPQRRKIRSHSSSPSINIDLRLKSKRMSQKIRSYKSLSELENYELKGFMDLGFTFPKDKLNPHMMSMVPGLKRLEEKDGGDQQEKGEAGDGPVRRPYLSEAWLVSRPESPLLNLRMLPKIPDGSDMKKHLKFWARNVALSVHEEP